MTVPATVATASSWSWNAEQTQAITFGVSGKSFCLIGAAGTGKTTTLRGTLRAMIDRNAIPVLASGTQHLSSGAPGVALVSYTRRAVRNIARQMPEDLKSHCITIHKLLEFAPEYYEETGPDGRLVNKMRFVPTRNRFNPLPRTLKTIVIDESSMVSIDLFELLLDALPSPYEVQFIFLGDLNQLPPVYGQAVLGLKLLELPIVELTQVYRQALESPIIALALAVKNNNFAQFNRDAHELWGAPRLWAAQDVQERIRLHKPGRGTVTIIPWKKSFDPEIALKAVCQRIPTWITEEFYDPQEDLMLCPWNKSFGTDEINKSIADTLSKKSGQPVYEVIAGFQKHYFAVGDKLLIDKQECWVEDIYANTKYVGKRPQKHSLTLDRWGRNSDASDAGSDFDALDVDALLASYSADDVEERVTEASHILKVRMVDSEEIVLISKAATINNSSFAYAITVHKAQGSECRRVFFITDRCHSQMLSRELVYTGITRAAEELVLLMTPKMLASSASKPRIKGDTLAAKLEFFNQRLKERIDS